MRQRDVVVEISPETLSDFDRHDRTLLEVPRNLGLRPKDYVRWSSGQIGGVAQVLSCTPGREDGDVIATLKKL